MNQNWRRDQLPALIAQLASRPGHEQVRVALTRLIVDGLGREVGAIDHEYRMPLIGGRADTLFASTVFELKTDLRRELPDVEAKLPGYLEERARLTRRTAGLGIATDGASFLAYELRDGRLVKIGEAKADIQNPEALLGWLEPAVSEREDLDPVPITIQRELGRESLTFHRAEGVLNRLWAGLRDHPEVKLKRDLWDSLLREVYGAEVGEDRLFLQHTYLTILAKTIAARALERPAEDAERILSGAALAEIGIFGAVESDFFDWVLRAPEGHDLVRKLALQVARFRLVDVETDVLKALYESLMDPEQRRDLGEYYTPDWLAAKLVRRAIPKPLQSRVLDPACGSGTFLFHAIRHLRAAATAAGVGPAERVQACVRQIRGMDVHPVAVIIARVTWLLALGPDVVERRGDLHVPVFLGDAMQWNLQQTGDVAELRVPVPDSPSLRVPAGFAEDQELLEAGVRMLDEGVKRGEKVDLLRRSLLRLPGIGEKDAAAMGETFERMQKLYQEGRDTIWPYVLRNLVRPLWLSRPKELADVVIGNPPWIAYRHLSPSLQTRLREASQRMHLWKGGKLATQQDMCALFTARAAQRYLKRGGTLAFVLPYAVLNRPAFEGLRTGDYRDAQLCWQEAWSLDETVQPLFPVPACVMIGKRAQTAPLPQNVLRFTGRLPRRDASEQEADKALKVHEAPWPPMPSLQAASPYRARFKNGATLYPRRLWFVERESAGRLGSSSAAPMVRGKIGKQDKKPWKDVEPPRGPVEEAFLRPTLLGENLAPFRLLEPALAVIPVNQRGHLLTASSARAEGASRLADWLGYCETKWALHASQDGDGQPKMSLAENIDHLRKLTGQFPSSDLRVAYNKSGTMLSAAVINEPQIIIDHMAYWAHAKSPVEARYLVGVLNAETCRERIADKQAKGQGGARHFDNLIWELPIPEYDGRNALHRRIAALAGECEALAATVPLDADAYFTTQRRAIRDALAAAGLMQRLDRLVAELLES
ncbi:MAG: N-6 DNA methylase [Roseomonas sp.]|nr:N-6 DNA methylase [Roseomonas sp.]